MRLSSSSQIFSNIAIGFVIAISVAVLQEAGVRWSVGLENGAIRPQHITPTSMRDVILTL